MRNLAPTMSSTSTKAEQRSFENWRVSMASLTGMGRIRSPNESVVQENEEDRATLESHWNRCEAWKKSLMTDSELPLRTLDPLPIRKRGGNDARPDDRVHAQASRPVRLPLQLLRHSMSPMSRNYRRRFLTRTRHLIMSKPLLLEEAYGGYVSARTHSRLRSLPIRRELVESETSGL
jgi:hypothetical protein